MIRISLRAAIAVTLAAAAFSVFEAKACDPYETVSCEEPEFPLPEYPCNCDNGGHPDVPNYYRLPDYAGNPYPATCGSTREQRLLHARWDIEAYRAQYFSTTTSPGYLLLQCLPYGCESIEITYDDGLKQDYLAVGPGVGDATGISLLGKVVGTPNTGSWQLDACQ